jgi:hypothetical protein
MIVLTAGYGPHAELMRITERHHRRWAEKIGASHVLRYGPEPWPEGTETRDGCWQKILAIQATLAGMGEREVLVWIEPDVLVSDMSANPLDAMPETAEWGMVWRGNERRVNPHFCTGVQIIRNTENVDRVLREVWQLGPIAGLFPGDCRPTNVVLSGRDRWPLGIGAKEAAELAYERCGCRIHPLPPAWNRHMKPYPPTPEQQETAVCLHWSRMDKDVVARRMKERLATVTAPYEKMNRAAPWPILPKVPQVMTLDPMLQATEDRLKGTPEFECGVLFTHHRTDGLTAENMASFGRHNPDCVVVPIATELDVFPGSYRLDENLHWQAITARRGRGAWRNLDWAMYLYYANRTVNCKRWIWADWDLHCTGPLKDFYGAMWDKDVVCAHPAKQGQPWHWFCEIPRLPAELQGHAAGVVPGAGTLISNRALAAMTAAAPKVSYDLFAELRIGTLAQFCGFEISQAPTDWTLRYTRRPEIEGPGLWHPVKEWSTLKGAKR